MTSLRQMVNSKVLYIGDPHVVPAELSDCGHLLEFVLDVAIREKVDVVVLLGDQHHTHSLMRLEVVQFWRTWLKHLREAGVPKVVMLKGNHDCFVDPSESGSALDAYRDFDIDNWLTIVDDVVYVESGVAFVPYCHTEEKFLKACKIPPALDAKTLVCHQSFQGSKFENGFLDPDGFDLSKVPQEKVISGHIHTPQEVGKCSFLGAPRWRISTDANVARSIWVIEHDQEGREMSRRGFDTGEVCRQIRHVEVTPLKPPPDRMDSKHQWHVDLVGPSEWVDEHKKKFVGMVGIRLRTRKTDTTAPRVRESEGVDAAFLRFVGVYKSKYGTPTDTLRGLVKERLAL